MGAHLARVAQTPGIGPVSEAFDALSVACAAWDPQGCRSAVAMAATERVVNNRNHEGQPLWALVVPAGAAAAEALPDQLACFQALLDGGLRLDYTTAKGESLLQRLRAADPCFADAVLSRRGGCARVLRHLKDHSKPRYRADLRGWWEARVHQFGLNKALVSPPSRRAPRL